MVITKKNLIQKITEYLNHQITLDNLVDWAEDGMQDADFEAAHFEVLRDIVARIGLADVRTFGLTWEDCEEFLARLGYRAHVEIIETA